MDTRNKACDKDFEFHVHLFLKQSPYPLQHIPYGVFFLNIDNETELNELYDIYNGNNWFPTTREQFNGMLDKVRYCVNNVTEHWDYDFKMDGTMYQYDKNFQYDWGEYKASAHIGIACARTKRDSKWFKREYQFASPAEYAVYLRLINLTQKHL